MRLRPILGKFILPLSIGISAIVVVAQVRQVNLSTLLSPKAVEEPVSQRTLTNDDPWVEFKNISQRFTGSKDLYYAGTISLKSEQDDLVLEKRNYNCQMSGQNFHYELDSVDMIYNNGLSLQVFHRERLMVIDKGKPAHTGPWALPSMDSLQRYAALHATQLFVYLEGAEKVLRVEQTGNLDHYAYELYYEPVTYNIKKVKLFTATTDNLDAEGANDVIEWIDVEPDLEEAVGSIELSMHEMLMTFDEVKFNHQVGAFNPEENFLRIRKKNIIPKEAYKNYRVVLLTDDYKLSN